MADRTVYRLRDIIDAIGQIDLLLDGKRQRISISIPERDLARLKTRAAEEGMPYQTLINSIFHKYVG